VITGVVFSSNTGRTAPAAAHLEQEDQEPAKQATAVVAVATNAK